MILMCTYAYAYYGVSYEDRVARRKEEIVTNIMVIIMIILLLIILLILLLPLIVMIIMIMMMIMVIMIIMIIEWRRSSPSRRRSRSSPARTSHR